MTVQFISSVNVDDMIEWIKSISFSDWPQQHKIDDQLRPSMVTDLRWHDFGKYAAAIENALMSNFANCRAYQSMLSVVMPGHSIPPHKDMQGKSWVCRVHVPLLSNEQSKFIVSGVDFHLVPGNAYRVNTEEVHSVENNGNTPRIHFMFDVGSA